MREGAGWSVRYALSLLLVEITDQDLIKFEPPEVRTRTLGEEHDGGGPPNLSKGTEWVGGRGRGR